MHFQGKMAHLFFSQISRSEAKVLTIKRLKKSVIWWCTAVELHKKIKIINESVGCINLRLDDKYKEYKLIYTRTTCHMTISHLLNYHKETCCHDKVIN